MQPLRRCLVILDHLQTQWLIEAKGAVYRQRVCCSRLKYAFNFHTRLLSAKGLDCSVA